MKDLIKALKIIDKYIPEDSFNKTYPFHCEHDTLYVCGVEVDKLSEEELSTLDDLGFFPHSEWENTLMSFKYGSC